MNILVYSWRDIKHPFAGGAEQVMHEHMKGWVRGGHTVWHFSSRIIGYPKRTEIIDGIRFIRHGYQLLGVNSAGFFWYLFGNHQRFDLVVDEFHGIPFFTPLFVRTKKLAVVQEIAGEVWFKNQLPFPLNIIIGIVGFISEPIIFLFYKTTPFMVGSESTKKDLIRMGINQKDISIVPHGLIKEPVENVEKEKVKTIIYLGTLAKDKGIEDALRTFSILHKKFKLNFWIVGKGGETYYNYLKDVVRRLDLLNNIKFWGFVSQKKKFELLTRAHILVNPSIREGWGLVNIEANSVGTPVVAYKSPGLVDSVKEDVSGIFCKENNPDSLAKAILTLLVDSQRLKRLSESAIRWSENFDWKKSKVVSLKLIERIYGKD